MYIDLPEKRYYGIGEVAKAFDVNTSLIRFWEKEFDILKPKKMRRVIGNLHLRILKTSNSSIIWSKYAALRLKAQKRI